MKVLVVSGSPHKEGMTVRVLKEASKGAKEEGAEVEFVTLADRRIKPCMDCDPSPCWEKLDCNIKDDEGLRLREAMALCDAFIFGAPVYFLSLCGLAKDFMDRMRYSKEHEGKPALPLAVAGGTGKGCVFALQEACRWLVMLGFRPFFPIAVTRYNFDVSLVEARERARLLLKMEREPYSGLWDMAKHYESTPMMRWGMAEELAYLARIEVEAIRRKGFPQEAVGAEQKLEKGLLLLEEGRKGEAFPLLAEAQEEAMSIFNRLSQEGI